MTRIARVLLNPHPNTKETLETLFVKTIKMFTKDVKPESTGIVKKKVRASNAELALMSNPHILQ